MTELILGTAQFGAEYGVTNQQGRLSEQEIAEILQVAAGAGIDLFDTSPKYSDAQQRLGAQSAPGNRRFVSKFGLPADDATAPTSANMFEGTLRDLGVDQLYGMLFHSVSDIRDDRAARAWDVLREARQAGVISRIGASIYDEGDLEVIVDRFPDLDLIQIPGNILDRRLLDSDVIRDLRFSGVEVHVRSAYLQGLLLSAPEELPDYFLELAPSVEALCAKAVELQTTVITLALGYLNAHPAVDAVLVGATSARELTSTVAAWNATLRSDTLADVPLPPASMLDPRLWPAKGATS